MGCRYYTFYKNGMYNHFYVLFLIQSTTRLGKYLELMGNVDANVLSWMRDTKIFEATWRRNTVVQSNVEMFMLVLSVCANVKFVVEQVDRELTNKRQILVYVNGLFSFHLPSWKTDPLGLYWTPRPHRLPSRNSPSYLLPSFPIKVLLK